MKKLIILFVLLLTVQVNAVTRYIDFNVGVGSDANDGMTEGQAWLTESYADTQLSTDDVLNYVQAQDDDANGVLADWEALTNDGVITQTKEIKQWAITWTISGYERFGRYVNGDFWVYDATSITIDAIDPAPSRSSQSLSTHNAANYTCILPHTAVAATEPGVGGSWTSYWAQEGGGGAAWSLSTDYTCRIKNGSMINPTAGVNVWGYDSSTQFSGYSAAFNVALNTTANDDTFPLAIASTGGNNGSSLISVVSHASAANKPQQTDASILTVISTVPSVGDFRPSYVTGVDKDDNYNVSDIDPNVYDEILQSVATLGSVLSQATAENLVKRPWIDHSSGFRGDYLHPSNNMPAYGANLCSAMGDAFLWLHLDKTDANKKMLLYYCLQLGIDNYGVGTNSSAAWVPADGGHGSGRYWPIIFAGIVFGDNSYKAVNDTVSFGEYEQTFTVASADIASFPYEKRAAGLWANGGLSSSNYLEYVDYHTDMPEWGIRHYSEKSYSDRFKDGATWTAQNYRICCTGRFWHGEALAALMTNYGEVDNGKDTWNHDSFFDYQDRYVIVMENIEFEFFSQFAFDMWEEYRANYATPWSGSYDITPAATPTSLAQVPDSNAYNSITVSWSGTAVVFDISNNPTLETWDKVAYLSVTSPSVITGLKPSTSYDIEVWGQDPNGIRSLVPDELTVTTEASLTSLLAYYKMDDAAGQTVVLDSSGNNFTGTAANNITSANGKVGNAISFNGTDDFVSSDEDILFQLSNGTIAVWAYLDSYAATADPTFGVAVIISKDDAGWNDDLIFSIGRDDRQETDDEKKLSLTIQQSGEEVRRTVFDPTDFPLNSWQHVAVSWGSLGILLYRNGILVDTDTYTGGVVSSGKNLYIGNVQDIAGRFWDGLIDDVRIYDVALSASDIRALYGGGTTNIAPILILIKNSQ